MKLSMFGRDRASQPAAVPVCLQCGMAAPSPEITFCRRTTIGRRAPGLPGLLPIGRR
jgi:hypothetical protein